MTFKVISYYMLSIKRYRQEKLYNNYMLKLIVFFIILLSIR